jgi:hypothetical protein
MMRALVTQSARPWHSRHAPWRPLALRLAPCPTYNTPLCRSWLLYATAGSGARCCGPQGGAACPRAWRAGRQAWFTETRRLAGAPGTLLARLARCWRAWHAAGAPGMQLVRLACCWRAWHAVGAQGTLLARMARCWRAWHAAGAHGALLARAPGPELCWNAASVRAGVHGACTLHQAHNLYIF